MSRLIFDEQGKLSNIDGGTFKTPSKKYNSQPNIELKTSDNLEFLKDSKEIEEINNQYWSLHENSKSIPPLKFSNGKTQEDVVKEITNLIKSGTKVIFLHGTCGTGKSAIALNIARVFGNASIVVPLKSLQKQYEEDYIEKKYLIKDKKKMKIAMITGRENHDSIIEPGKSCADPYLPENIKITEKNSKYLRDFYKNNPFTTSNIAPDYTKIRRMSIAPSNPYWSPIIPAEFEGNILKDANKQSYIGCDQRIYNFFHRKSGCSYYDQFLAYLNADAIIFNSAKYKSEINIGRKPHTEVDIIDEADEFLDSFFQQEEINLSRLKASLSQVYSEYPSVKEIIQDIQDKISLEEKNKRAIGIDENEVYHIKDTKILEILSALIKNKKLESEIIMDELNYSYYVLEKSKNFSEVLNDTYLTYRKDDENNLYIKLASTNLSAKFQDLIEKTKALVFMSGTLHSQNVIRNIFGIEDFKIVEAETLNQGSLEIIRTGNEFDCKYSNFKSENHSREDYLRSLSSCLDKTISPTLIHVNAFQDLPNNDEKDSLGLTLMSSERLKEIQKEDKIGRAVSIFKNGLSDSLFTTKCSRGADFPGDTCKSIIFTKYPNPNISDTFWKILKKTHPDHFWECYKDKAWREFMQRIYRALRSQNDHVYILSPDIRVLDAVQKIQAANGK